jgi:hypothetical protein
MAIVSACGEDDLDKTAKELARVAAGLTGQIELETDIATDTLCFIDKANERYFCHVYRNNRQQDGRATMLNYTVTYHPNSDGLQEWRARADQSLAGLPEEFRFDAVPDFAPNFD